MARSYIHPMDWPGSVADPNRGSEADDARQDLNAHLERVSARDGAGKVETKRNA